MKTVKWKQKANNKIQINEMALTKTAQWKKKVKNKIKINKMALMSLENLASQKVSKTAKAIVEAVAEYIATYLPNSSRKAPLRLPPLHLTPSNHLSNPFNIHIPKTNNPSTP